MAQPSGRDLSASLKKLEIRPTGKRTEPVDSWEDEEDDGEDTEKESGKLTPVKSVGSASYPNAPPPTPSSPSFTADKTAKGSQYETFPPYGFNNSGNDQDVYTTPLSTADGERRPDKSTAVASRLIAAGIGQKAPRRTQEQREYDQAMKIQEKKKRDRAKAEEERMKAEAARAKQAVWED